MTNRPAHTLINRAHTDILVELARSSLAITAGFRLCFGGNVLHLRLPFRRVRVRKRETNNNDAAAKCVAEIDAFGEGAADYGEEEGAAAFS